MQGAQSVYLLTAILKSGKTTSFELMREILIEDFGINKDAIIELQFAYKIKKTLSEIMNVSLESLNDQAVKKKPFSPPMVLSEKILNKVLDDFEVYCPLVRKRVSENFLGTIIENPRKFLQIVATELLRVLVDNDIHVKFLERRLKENREKIVIITDCLFPNEFEVTKRIKITSIGITREQALRESQERIEAGTAHESELYASSLIERSDYKINNDGSLEELRENLKIIILDDMINKII